LAADCPGDCAAQRRIYGVGGVDLTASGGIWAVGDASGFGDGYREDGGFIVGEIYLAGDVDARIAIQDQVRHGTIGRGYRELGAQRAAASIGQSAVDVTGDGDGAALRAAAWVVRQGDGNIAGLAVGGGSASRQGVWAKVIDRSREARMGVGGRRRRGRGNCSAQSLSDSL